MKVLLIQPNYRNIYAYAEKKEITPIFPPLGLAYIAAVLQENNIEVKILEANAHDLNSSQIKEFIEEYSPDFVGITSTTSLIEEAHEIAKLCPKGTKVIIGGIHASSMPAETMNNFERFDYLARGEGEFTMLELAQKKPVSKIRGLSYRIKGKIIHNPDRDLNDRLDELPLPSRELLPMDKYFSVGAKQNPSDYILSSRGCPYQCIFCADHLVHGRKFRFRSPENIIKEVEEIYRRGAKDWDFVDDNFTLISERVEQFCDMMIERGLNKKMSWRCSNGIRVDRITPELLKKMKKAGCYMVSLGIESGNEKILNNMKKNTNLEKVEQAVKWCKEAGIETRGLFMFGNLGENRETMQDTINFSKKLDLDTATFHITIPFPNTDYWKIVSKEGKIYPKSYRDYIAYGNVIFQHGELDEKTLLEMQKKAYKEFYFRPKIFIRALKNIRDFEKFKIYLNAGLAFLRLK
ncbi:MAG: B12-binding domain-containing radical SAM protein [Candidatus Pacearchaeota archaeon]|nr:B12-binding domain-containing radical SAM protein [Candidatus Pacearchaeota archaeon]